MTINQILTSLHSLSHEDVRRVNELAYRILKDERSAQVRSAKSKLHVGMKVSFNGKHGCRMVGTIQKVNRTKCVVDTGEYRMWTVPMTMLKAV